MTKGEEVSVGQAPEIRDRVAFRVCFGFPKMEPGTGSLDRRSEVRVYISFRQACITVVGLKNESKRDDQVFGSYENSGEYTQG